MLGTVVGTRLLGLQQPRSTANVAASASHSPCAPFSQVSQGQAKRRWGYLTATANAPEGSASLDLLTSGSCQPTLSPGVIFSQKSS